MGILNDSFRAHDDISSLTLVVLEERLMNEATRPAGFRTAMIDKSLLIFILVNNDSVPNTHASVTVFSKLLVRLSYEGNLVPESKYNDTVHGSLQTMSQLYNQCHC